MLRYFNRAFLAVLGVVGVGALLALALAVALTVRLQQGPLAVDFLTDRIEEAFARQQTGFVFSIGRTELVWGNPGDPFVLDMRNIRIFRSDQTPVAGVDRLRVVMAKRGLLLGQVVPKELRLYGPVLRLTRNRDQALTLNVGSGLSLENPQAVEQAWRETIDAPPIDPSAQREMIAHLLDQMRDPAWHGVLGSLRQVTIAEAFVTYEDKILETTWQAEQARIVIARAAKGLVADTVFRLRFGEGASLARVRLTHGWDTGETAAQVFFSGLVPAQVAQESSDLAALRDIAVPLQGQVSVFFDQALRFDRVEGFFSGGAGTVNYQGLYPQPAPVAGGFLRGQYSFADRRGAVEAFQIDLAGARAEGSARFDLAGETETALSLQAELRDMPLDNLAQYWPSALGEDAQLWVTQHLSDGMVRRATIDLALARGGEKAALSLGALSGEIAFDGVTVDYFPPLPPVKGVAGTAVYDAERFRIETSGGSVNGMKIGQGTVVINNLQNSYAVDDHADIDIRAALSGPLSAALALIDAPPLGYPSALGMKKEGVEGMAEANVRFAFPLHHDLTLAEVEVTAEATVRDAFLPDIVAGEALSGGPYRISVQEGVLSLKGAGRLGAAPATLDWQRDFGETAAPEETLAARLTVPAEMLVRFGVPAAAQAKGVLPVQLDMTRDREGRGRLSLSADLAPFGFFVPMLGVEKAVSTPGTLSTTLHLQGDRLQRISALRFEAPELAASGDLAFSSEGGELRLVSGALSDVRLGATDLRQVRIAAWDGVPGGYDLSLTGARLDVRAWFAEKEKPPRPRTQALPGAVPLRLQLAAGQVLTVGSYALSETSLLLERGADGRIDRLVLDTLAGKAPLRIRYEPAEAAPGYTLRASAEDTGAALAILGVTRALRGGRLSVEAKPALRSGAEDRTRRDMSGTLILQGFEVRDAPVLAKLFNALSLTGLRDLLGNQGLSFGKARAQFDWVDRSVPQAPENIRALQIKDGQTSGASLGLTVEGRVDFWDGTYDLSGTVVPVNDLNRLLQRIPVLGDVLTAGGEGIFAAQYSVKGAQKDPDIKVNPLSALAPGILRKIFFDH